MAIRFNEGIPDINTALTDEIPQITNIVLLQDNFIIYVMKKCLFFLHQIIILVALNSVVASYIMCIYDIRG